MTLFFFVNDTATPYIDTYCATRSLDDARPICFEDARSHGVDADALGAEFLRQAKRQHGDGAFRGGVIDEQVGRAQPRRRRGQVDDGAAPAFILATAPGRSEEHTSALQSPMRISYAVFCLKEQNHSAAPRAKLALAF